MCKKRYAVIFTRNKFQIYYTNIIFEKTQDEIKFFKSFRDSFHFNLCDIKLDQGEYWIDSWFPRGAEAEYIFKKLDEQKDCIIVSLDKDKEVENRFLVIKKEKYNDFYEKNKSEEDIKLEGVRSRLSVFSQPKPLE